MSITSLGFVAFCFAVLILYYVIPRRFQWVVLLAASCAFYAQAGLKNCFFVLTTATSVYAAARLMDWRTEQRKAYLKANKDTLSADEKKQYRAKIQKQRKAIMLGALLLNLLILCVFKYANFAGMQVFRVMQLFGAGGEFTPIDFIVPLGISFYTFQTIGYLVDVYWEKVPSQRNFAKLLLFVSFFPQMTQGPISDYEQLSGELLGEHEFSWQNYSHGVRRMVWGFFKKLLVADVFGLYVRTVFAHFPEYTGVTTLLGAFCYSIQIYADFSGYMDIMCGLCQTLGIRLTENFNRPYFSKSIAEYWRRWHISLGEWFKKYIYYPIGMSTWSRRFAKNTRARFGKHFANTVPATIALLATWFATGLWHGASWSYVIWGLLNGAFIILSIWMEPVYVSIRAKLNIQEGNRPFRYFQVARTFFLVTLIKVLPEVGGIREGVALIGHIFADHRLPGSLQELFVFVVDTRFWYIAFAGAFLMLVVSLIQRGHDIQTLIDRVPMPVRVAVLCAVIVCIAVAAPDFAYLYGGGGFLYAGF